MKSASSALQAHLAGETTTLATCWRIIRTDGRTFFFTDHDRDLEFEGDVYRAKSGYSRTAISNDASMAVDNLDVEGVFDSAEITETDLRAGLFDHAEVRIFLVNWRDLSQGSIRMRRGWFGEVGLSEAGVFRTELRGMTQALSQHMGEIYSPECRADLGDHRCTVPIEPPEIQREADYAVGDVVRVRTSGSTASGAVTSFVNPSFEADGAVDGGAAVTGWTVVSGDWDVHDGTNGGLAPFAGGWYLEGGNDAVGDIGEIRQEVGLAAGGLDAGKIDAGDYTLTLGFARANSFADDEGQVIAELLDGGGALIAVMGDTGLEEITPEDTWAGRSFADVAVPAGARTLRIRVRYRLVTGSQANAAFDAFALTWTDLDAGADTSEVYENRFYACVTAGTTAAEQPVYDTTPGAETADGTAVFAARDAWTRHGTVTEVIDRSTVVVAIAEPRAADGWFTGGVFTWETGDNAGRACEVRSWVQATATLTLFLPQPFAIQLGDAFRVWPGCDKRLATCTGRFGNVLNFRGEPYLPGQDELMRYPDAH